MASILSTVLLLLLACSYVFGDIYLHSPRGSNDRLNEESVNRQNPQRLFNSQNNNDGGYAWGPSMYFYVGSVMQVEWTNQHSCGLGNAHCQVVLQYMCDPTLRDGNPLNASGITTINPYIDDGSQIDIGRQETIPYYLQCIQRERNTRLFIADQNLNGNTARFTRQQPGGTQYGTECPEERDYYPYWAHTPWKDIAVFTDNISLCEMYQSESQNVAPRGNCSVATYNNEFDCQANDGVWSTIPSWNIPPPECIQASWTRDNHLGNTINGQMFNYNWTIPNDVNKACALRIRYNISTGDYDPWNTDARANAGNSPVYEYEEVSFGVGVPLRLNIQTNQFGRTFQDRSYQFEIRARPSSVSSNAKIYNLNVRGKRGNIVEVFPSVEYDFVPNKLYVTTADYVHFQWTGSDYNPPGNEGNGNAGTDRSNIVQIADSSKNVPVNITGATMLGPLSRVSLFATLGQTDPELDNATTPYFDGGLVKMGQGEYHYMSTRNNDFSNRSQKGVIFVASSGVKLFASMFAFMFTLLCL